MGIEEAGHNRKERREHRDLNDQTMSTEATPSTEECIVQIASKLKVPPSTARRVLEQQAKDLNLNFEELVAIQFENALTIS